MLTPRSLLLLSAAAAAALAASCVSVTPETPAAASSDIDGPPGWGDTMQRHSIIEDAEALGVGRRVSVPPTTLLDGGDFSLEALLRGKQAAVLVMTSTACPISSKYAPRLAAIETEYARKGVAFAYVNTVAAETTDQMRQQIRDYAYKGAYLPDRNAAVAGALAARTTTEVFVIDPGGTLTYRGAVDDQYGIGTSLDAPRRLFLRDALDATLAGARPKVAATYPPGCLLDRADTPKEPANNLTYFGRISRIIQTNCVSCHRPLGQAPFSLAGFQSIPGRASMIEAVVRDGIMPPSHNTPGATTKGGPWVDDHCLTPAEREDLLTWLRSDRPMGGFSDAPSPPEFPQGWAIGTPDLPVTAGPLRLPVDGPLQYGRFLVPTNTTEDQWLSAIEFRPMRSDAVHHALVWMIPPGAVIPPVGEPVPGADGDGHGLEFLGAYSLGQGLIRYDEGTVRRLPAGTVLLVDLYARPMGKEMFTSLRVGMRFAKTPPRREVRSIVVQASSITLEPGAAAVRSSATVKLAHDASVLSITPYMKLRGRSLALSIRAPGARGDDPAGSRLLLDAPRYDPRWQIRYEYAEPQFFPAGASLVLRGVHDNSEANRNNPDPAAVVHAGPGAGAEAMLVAVETLTPVKPATPDASKRQ